MEYLTMSMAARRVHVCDKTMYNWIHGGILPAFKLPGKRGLRVRGDVLDAFMDERYSFHPRSRVAKLVEIGGGH